jgi:hypothetical protein
MNPKRKGALKMPTIEKRPVQIDMSTELIAEIERCAAEEMLTRTAWMRRTLNSAVKAQRNARPAEQSD